MGQQIDNKQVLVMHREVQEARMVLLRLQEMADRVETLVQEHPAKEAIYAEAGDLLTLVPQLLGDLKTHLSAMSLITDTWDQREVRQQLGDVRKKEISNLLRRAQRLASVYAQSQLPGTDPDPSRSPHPNSPDAELGGISTFNTGGQSKEEKERQPANNSIYRVEDADDRPKAQSDGRDHRDWSGLRPEYNTPSVPDTVRR